MKSWSLKFVLFIFSFLFFTLSRALLSHASELSYRATDGHYPGEVIEHFGFVSLKQSASTWSQRHPKERDQTLLRHLGEDYLSRWDSLARDLFVERLLRKSAKAVAATFPDLPLKTLVALEDDLRNRMRRETP